MDQTHANGGEWRDSVDASLGEASEAYQIDIYADGSYQPTRKPCQ